MPSWLRAALITSVQTFLATALVTLLGLLGEIQEWINDSTDEPDWSNAAKLVGSAFVAAVSGLITAVWRYLRPPEEDYNGSEG